MKLLTAGRQIGRTLKNAARLRTIVGVFAKHGFANIAERVKLGKFVLERLSSTSDIENLSVAERVRLSFEELGPTYVKLGQLLATRPDLVPEDFVTEFEKLHSTVQPLPFAVIEGVLKEEFGDDLSRYFLSFDESPLGSASIAQVHKATLVDGTEVVVKVQRPGIIDKINDDLSVLYLLAELLETYIEETRPFNPIGIVDEYFKTLELETNFVVEANNVRRFSENFKDIDHIIIPKVYIDLTTEKVLTMDLVKGIPLANPGALGQEGVIPEEVIKRGLKAYLKMVFSDGIFHGDLHAGNFFVMPHNNIGLIDFGVVGRLNNKTQSSIASMLVALAKEDYERLAYEYIDLAPFSEKVNVDLFAKELRDLVAPFFGLTLKNVNLGKLLLKSSSIAARHGISVPTELMLYFKSLVAIEGLGRRIKKDFDFLQYSIEFASELVRLQYEPTKVVQDLSQLAREARSLVGTLPRQLHYMLRKVNSPNYASKIKVEELNHLRKSIELSFNLLFLGLIIGSLVLSGTIIFVNISNQNLAGFPPLSFTFYILALILSVVAFINYIKK